MKLNGMTRPVFRQALQIKKNSPHIFFGAGVVGFVGTVVLAAKATLKMDGQLDDIKHHVNEVKDMYKGKEDDPEYKKDLVYVYGRGARDLGKLYGPTIVVGGLSIAALTGSHVQLTRRNTALASTLAVVSKAYDDYRQRVIEELGSEKELDLHYNLADEHAVDGSGKIQVAKGSDNPLLAGCSPFAVIFDKHAGGWQSNVDPDYNRMFLQAQQNYANQYLQAHGHVFLNQIHDWLGMPHTTAGAIYGWVIREDGDNSIDLGIYEYHNADYIISGIPEKIILDPNVQGVIYDLI